MRLIDKQLKPKAIIEDDDSLAVRRPPYSQSFKEQQAHLRRFSQDSPYFKSGFKARHMKKFNAKHEFADPPLRKREALVMEWIYLQRECESDGPEKYR